MASTHKHIRSGTANKRPTTAIADGQIALNTNLSSPGLFFKDSTGAEILKIGPVHVGATAPNVSPAGSAGNSTGEVWLDTSLTPVGVKIWNGSAFVNATPIGSTTVQGLLELATDAETQAGADTARAVTSASLQSKLSDSTSTTSATTIASSTAVKAAYDLANAALPKAGGTVTGNLEIGTAGSLSFEGATADGFETTIAVVDPTADRTITLPNTTGTVVTTGDTGTVTSTMLLDGTILNEDINASASIAYSKLATLTSGNIVLGSSANVATSTAVTGDVTITNAGVTAISAGVIVNADVNASAAIAGSKVAPDFGAQNIVTTGSSTAATFNPTGTTAPVTGVYSPGANRLGITTNSVERVEFGTSEVVFNDDAADYDFRIEGDTNSNLFFADASAEAVGIRTATPVSEFNVSVGNGGNITISNTNDAHSAGLAFGDTTSNSSGRITYDHSTNALGIIADGTQRLTINNAAATSTLPVVHPLGAAATPSLTFTGDTNTGIYSPGADQVAISTGGSGRLFVDASGNIGINYSTPSNFAGGDLGATAPVVIGDGTATRNLTLFGANNGYGSVAFADSTTGSAKYAGLIQYYHTDNSLQFYTNSTERLRITSAGLVGIGNSSPGAKLDVSGDVIFNGGGTQFPIQIANAFTPNIQRADLSFFANATSNNALRVGTIASNGGVTLQGTRQNDSSQKVNLVLNPDGGNVGIGSTAPNRKLEVSDASADNFIRVNTTGATKSGIEFASGGTVYSQLYFNNVSPYDLSLLQQYTTGSLILGTNSTERARIDSSGRLLVGTSSALTGTDTQYSRLVVTGNTSGASAGIMSISRPEAATSITTDEVLGAICFADSGAGEYGRISCAADANAGTNDYPGRLVFSTTADGASSPTERMRIANTGATNVFASTANVLGAGSNQAAGTTYYLFYGANNASNTTTGTTCFLVFTNGNVQNTNNSYAGISDAKLKENIVDATSQWSDIKALQVRKYNFKEGQTHTQIGLIAQEVELVSPGLVTESPDRDAEGNNLGTVTKSVNYSVLYMKAVKALQEAMERIEALEAKVAALEGA